MEFLLQEIKLGRTPVIIGKRENAFAASSESSSFPNLGFEVEPLCGSR
jgi:amidophosphoribosyltransferase